MKEFGAVESTGHSGMEDGVRGSTRYCNGSTGSIQLTRRCVIAVRKASTECRLFTDDVAVVGCGVCVNKRLDDKAT